MLFLDFSAIDQPLFYIVTRGTTTEQDFNDMRKAFVIGDMRYFDEDPRFGLITLSVASRALSPAVNDPGTAIQIISSYVRLFSLWAEPLHSKKSREKNDRCGSRTYN
jgi:uncharacterized membrane protein